MRKGWKETTLGEVAKCAGGSSFPIEHQNGRTGIPFIKVSDLNTPGNDREITSALNYITSELAAELGVRVWPIDTVVFPKVGAALLTDKRRILTQDTIFDNNLLGLVGNHEIYPRFLLLFMETIRMSDFAQMGALPSVSHGIIEKLCILLPPLTEQRRIVDVIGSVDAYVAALERYANAARTARAALLHELLTTNTQGWKETTLGEVADFINGYPFKPNDLGDEGIPVIRIKQLLDVGEPVDRTNVLVPLRCQLRDGDLVFSWSGTLAIRSWNRGPAYLNQHLFRVVEREGVQRSWLALCIDNAIGELSEKSHGTTMKHITKKTLLPHAVDLPPLAEQRRIVDVIGAVDGAIAGADRAAEDARNLRSGLLSDLLSGDHGIPEAYDELLESA